MRCKRALLVLTISAALGLFGAGCSLPLKETNPKRGLLDRLAENYSFGMDSQDEDREPARTSSNEKSVAPAVGAENRIPAALTLRWPLARVQVTSPFGRRGLEFHEGLDLRAETGTPVYAAHSGQVLYADSKLSGYGQMVVIRHSSGLSTVYGHNSKLLVKKGQWVSQGALISLSGNTGHSNAPHLHFEVRSGVSPVNPMNLLPKLKSSS